MKGIRVSTLVKEFNLRVLTKEVDLDKIIVSKIDLNRPALQLNGYYDHFDNARIQIIGNVEYHYMNDQLRPQEQLMCYRELFRHEIPALIFCRGFEPVKGTVALADASGVPVLVTEETTTRFSTRLARFLNYHLAPSLGMHGVLMDVYGEGILIEGESGIGKSEIALELLKRGHRLVSDDVVEIRKLNDQCINGCAPEITRHFIEVRGIGIIDVKQLFGVGSVRKTQDINLVVQLEKWNPEINYDRMGLTENFRELLGVNIPLYKIPVSPGRNMAVIIEVAAMNHRQKQMGYNAAEELNRRFMEKMRSREEEDIL